MTSEERSAGRYQRRKAERDKNREGKLSRYDDFSLVTDPNNLYKAFRKCRKGVAWKESTQRYEMNLFANILETKRRLEAGEDAHSGFVEFTLHERGKIRHIKSVHISKRVADKTMCDEVLVPILTKSLIHDNGASVKKKGVHFAIRRLITHLSKFYRQNGYSNKGYALTIDLSKYFDSIRHDILMKMVEKRVHDKRVLEYARRAIKAFGPGVSLGLGSQISQIFAIYFLTGLDHTMKKEIKFLGHYMDDYYAISHDKNFLEKCLAKFIMICNTFGIKVNGGKTRIFPLREGILFLKGKYYLLENGKVLKKPTKESAKRMRRKLRKFRKLIDGGRMNYQDLRTAYQSWRGNYLKRFHAYKTVQNMDSLYDTLFINNR